MGGKRTNWMRTTVRVTCALFVPYMIGVLLSDKIVPIDLFHGYYGSGVGVLDFIGATLGGSNDTTSAAGYADTSQQRQEIRPKMDEGTKKDPFEGVTISMHRNGESDPCGKDLLQLTDISTEFHKIRKERNFRRRTSKHQFDTTLTTALSQHYTQPTPTPGETTTPPSSSSSCGPEIPHINIIHGPTRKQWGRGLDYSIYPNASPLLSFCDMGQDRTVVLPDHKQLLPVLVLVQPQGQGDATTKESLPCHFYTREGLRVTSMDVLVKVVQDAKRRKKKENNETLVRENEKKDCRVGAEGHTVCSDATPAATDDTALEFKLFAVPAGRVFMFAPNYVGEVFDLHHMKEMYGRDVSLVVMSLVPRVFDVLNFFNQDESREIVQRALDEKSDSHRMKRSSTGATGYNVNSQRTSENGFDTSGKVAMAVKRRCMSTLGFDEYTESYTDGLQVLRYNKTTAYIPHLDWIDDPGEREQHDYITSNKGTNRFATILLYMSDLNEDEGGETVFAKGWPDVPETERISKQTALAQLRESGDASFLETGTWQEKMVADCRSRLAVRPHMARAVLFYSQHPNGEEDHASLHGGCPVLSSVNTKWAANLWAWNGPRVGYPGSPINPKFATKDKEEIKTQADGSQQVTFTNSGKDPNFAEADMYYIDTFWAPFSHGSPPVSVNTFDGHVWNVKRKSDKKLLQTWTIGQGERKYKYKV